VRLFFDWVYSTNIYTPVASMAEEVHNPSEILPKAMTWAVPIGTLCGVVFLLPILFTLPDVVILLQGQFNPEYSSPDLYMVASFFWSTNWPDVYIDNGL
jgi:amino acid transporter